VEESPAELVHVADDGQVPDAKVAILGRRHLCGLTRGF
jgi:hypothetical protein